MFFKKHQHCSHTSSFNTPVCTDSSSGVFSFSGIVLSQPSVCRKWELCGGMMSATVLYHLSPVSHQIISGKFGNDVRVTLGLYLYSDQLVSNCAQIISFLIAISVIWGHKKVNFVNDCWHKNKTCYSD